MSNIEFVQYLNESNINSIPSPKIDGDCKILLEKHMLESSSQDSVAHIFSNAFKTLQYLINPNDAGPKHNKILCLGKVQSGKTAFFISSIALAFDNGYNLAYVIGGTKTKLKDQNYDRLVFEFKNNPKVKVIDIAAKDHEEPIELIQQGYKVIIVALKNVGSDNANLGVVESYSSLLGNIPSIIIDDEGDECSPGAPKLKSRNPRAGRTHDVLSDIINNINICTFLSVTATPQANFLISTIDELSPDFALLVEPGKGYTGGNSFHDVYNNPHVIEISDSNSFNYSTPDSFKKALNFFIFSVIYQNYRQDLRDFSMLVHPSSLTKVQSMVVEKVRDQLEYVKDGLSNINNLSFDSLYQNIYDSGKDLITEFLDYSDFKSKTLKYLYDVLNSINVFEFNVSETGKQSILEEKEDNSKYKIYVGGNMLGRGLTIKNLNVTYMYRDSKITQIDTLYQRARWFGYKSSYFDICRVYMTKDLKEKFIDTVENENDMWTSINAFLLTKTDIKKFPRLFTLKNEKLRLTRTSVSKTVCVERVNPGYDYDKSIDLSNDQVINNRHLYENIYKKYKSIGQDVQYGNSSIQHHFIIEMKFTDFYQEFLSKYEFPRGSKFGPNSFKRLLQQIYDGQYEDVIKVVLMRYRTGEFRSPIAGGHAIKELPQSYDNGTEYPGDKSLPDLEKVLHIQLHPVYIDKSTPEKIIPLIALNNPITAFNVRYVTGDNYYEGI